MKYKTSDLSVEDCAAIRRDRRRGTSYVELAETHNCSIKKAVECVLGYTDHDCDEPPVENDKPWTEAEVVEELYVEHNMFFTEMADMLGCHPETARNWVYEHDVSVVPSDCRTSSKTVRLLQRKGAEQMENGDFELMTARDE